MASNDAVRASRRPKNSSTKRRATCVESTRSAGAWKEPTLSEREWRSATEAALGANGSWTCTKSGGAVESASSIVREMSSGGAGIAPRRAPASGSSSPTPSTRTSPSGAEQLAGADQPPRVAHERRRVRRRQHHDAGGRRAASSPESASTKALTSCSSSQGYGETCAMEKRSGTAAEA